MILKKGTIVKHGTSYDRLESIFQNGLISNATRNKFREQEEISPVVKGIYVANNLSYFGAYLAFSSKMYENQFNNIQQGTMPIVLHIQLQEDCELLADEDYVSEPITLKKLKKQSKHIWLSYETGVIQKNKIPSSWIIKFEYPFLISKNINISNYQISLLENDLWLLIFGYLQHVTKINIKEFQKLKKHINIQQSSYNNFTNIKPFSYEEFYKLKKSDTIDNKEYFYKYAKFLFKQLTIKIYKLKLPFR
jgi:hypothetical protein